MKLSSLNEWLTLAANIGVLAGIIFLAIEMQQNTEMMQAQTRDSVTDKLVNWFMDISTDPDAARILNTGNSLQELDAAVGEPLIYNFIVNSNLRLWENELYQYEKGLFEEEEFLARKESWGLLVRMPGYQRVWESNKNTYSPRFRAEIDSMLNNSER